MCDSVASQLVGHETKRFLLLTLQELSKESLCRTPVSTGLHENIDHVTVLIDRPPEVLALTVDRDKYFIQKPRIAETTLAAFQSTSVLRSEFVRPLPDRFISHAHAALSEQIFNFPKAQTESIVEPHSVTNDFWWKAMPKIRRSTSSHPTIVQRGYLT